MKVVALAGGTGSAKLLRGMKAEMGEFTVVSNVGDNFWNHGLYICPDIDIAIYTLAGLSDVDRGWGIGGDSFNVLSQLGRLGEETWFNLGDKDLATHIFRTEQLAKGNRLGDITTMLCERLKVSQRVLPCTDDRLETFIKTDIGEMHLQEFWVKNHGDPQVEGVEYRGSEGAKPEERVLAALESADLVVFCPANPVTSIQPILAVEGLRKAIERSNARRVAVSPMIAGAPVSGPAAKMMRAIGAEASSTSVALLYKGLIDSMLIDEADGVEAVAIQSSGVQPIKGSILMKDHDDERRLAKMVLEA